MYFETNKILFFNFQDLGFVSEQTTFIFFLQQVFWLKTTKQLFFAVKTAHCGKQELNNCEKTNTQWTFATAHMLLLTSLLKNHNSNNLNKAFQASSSNTSTAPTIAIS